MKVLLTGATGFIGSHVLDRLCAKEVPVAVLIRPGANKRFLDKHLQQVELRMGSINDPESLDQALSDVTHVIHCAGSVKALRVSEFYEVNQFGTRAIINAINHQQGRVERLVHLSSLAAGGPATSDPPAVENDSPHPVSEYGKSKLAGEYEIQEHCRAPFVILRPPAVYGPRDFEFLRLFKAVKLHLLPSFGGGRQELSFVYVEDLADVIVACLDHPAVAGRSYYVACSEVVTARALAEEIAAQMKVWTVPLPLPVASLWPVCFVQEAASRLTGVAGVLNRQKYRELRAPGWVCNPARLAQETGLTCATTLKRGLEKTLAWYLEQGWL